MPVDILVAGAGPTGLALALHAHALGARVRIIERRTERFRPSRALIIHPRTLEVLRPLGIVPELIAGGDPAPTVSLYLGSRTIPVQLGPFALADTVFPFLAFQRQAAVEAVLADGLTSRGLRVERGVELVDLNVTSGGVTATLASDGTRQPEPVRCRYLVGCDGSASTVRRLMGAAWHGGPYSHEAVLADVELDTDLSPRTAHASAGRQGLLFLYAMGEQASWRILATRPAKTPGRPPSPVPGAELQTLLDNAGWNTRIRSVAWANRIGLQHRLASTFRRGPLFIAGDAAHAHSPAGGQGLNTGIQDALNLSWKLAFASTQPQPTQTSLEPLLDSYEQERRPVASTVLAATRALFWVEAGTDPVASILRTTLAPLATPVVPAILRQRRIVAAAVRRLSQLTISYRNSVLSHDDTTPSRGDPHRPGERLPDETITSRGRPRRLHELLATPGLHVLLQRDAAPIHAAPRTAHTHVHRIDSWPGRGVLIVRPDGYIGYRSATTEPDHLIAWLTTIAAH